MKTCSTLLIAVLSVAASQAASLYWDGTGTSWNVPASWSTSASSTTPDPGAVPGSSDIVLFNIDGEADAQAVTLDADQAASKVSVRGSAAGGVTLMGGGTDRTLSLGSGGLEVLDGAGPLTIGSTDAGQGVGIQLTANQIWTNGCANSVVVNNTIRASGSQTLKLSGGTFRLDGSNTFSGGISFASATTLEVGNDFALGTGTFKPSYCTLLVNDFPRTLANKIRSEQSAGTYWTGDAGVTLTGGDGIPALAMAQYSNRSLILRKSAPFVVSGVWSLCDSSGGINNNPTGLSMDSGANAWVVGGITDNNAGNMASANQGFAISFNGAGANLTIYGNNSFCTNASSSVSASVANNSGYNSVTVGGPGGPGATITPLGAASIFSNSGSTFFLKALENGQILGNGVCLGGSAGGWQIGFDGTNDLTVAGKYVTGNYGDTILPNIAAATLTLAGEIRPGTKRLAIGGCGDVVFSGTSLFNGSGNGLGKIGPAVLTLSGTNTSTGANNFNAGAVVLDYSAENANRLCAVTNNAAALTLGGVDLQLKGGSFAQTLGADSGTTFAQGQSRIRRTGGGASMIALGPITRSGNAAAAVNFEPGVASTTSGDADHVLGSRGCFTVDGTDWATGGGIISAYTNYTSFASPGTDKHIQVTGDDSAGYVTVNTLKIAPTAPGQSLSIAGNTLTLAQGGLLFTGDEDYRIVGNNIRGCTDYLGEMVVHQYGSGTLTIDSAAGGYSLVKAGPGLLVLSNPANQLSSRLSVIDGTLTIAADGSIGKANASLMLDGGRLLTTNSFAIAHNVMLGAGGGTVEVADGTELEVSGVVSSYSVLGTSYSPLEKTGAGTLLLSGKNTYAGPTMIKAGTLKLGHDNGLSKASTNDNRFLSPVTVRNGSSLDVAGHSASIGKFTLENGTVADSVGGGALGAYGFYLDQGVVDVALTDVIVPNSGNKFNGINLFKRTANTVVLNGTNSYSGTTFVEAGTLRVNGSLASSVIVETNGTLCGVGTLARTVNVEGGVLAPGVDGAGSGTITLGRFLRIADGGSLKIGVGAAASGRVVMTHPEARVLLQNVRLDLSLLPGGVPTLAAGVTVIDNQGSEPVEGAFTDLPEGGVFDIGNGRFVAITYAGGDGNDVVALRQNRSTVLVLR